MEAGSGADEAYMQPRWEGLAQTSRCLHLGLPLHGDEAGGSLGGCKTLEEEVIGASPGAHKKRRQVPQLCTGPAMTRCPASPRSMPDSSLTRPMFAIRELDL